VSERVLRIGEHDLTGPWMGREMYVYLSTCATHRDCVRVHLDNETDDEVDACCKHQH
jgi:hypothetical protein